ncbi:hypothetical protein P43SY_007310 [Pythium insidiosum]|uniref:carbonic anhydrase n=1 Tax=Pythium insidiosum TaxID=114742 RepID=A0AAD5M1S9_PYTIN|nr:hypothetical protein P43SY_007310 [Pythium insidiosum]
MKLLAALAATTALLCATSASADDSAVPKWSYRSNDGQSYGPSKWGSVGAACDGKRQSPVDITVKSVCDDGERQSPLAFSGECAAYKVQQVHDTFKAESANGACQVAVKGKPYSFLQLHFHMPSEHTLNGKAMDAEVHFVHKAADGGLAVVGLFLEKDATAETDPFIASFWKQVESASTNATLNATLPSFHPAVRTSAGAGHLFNYPGSLTTPTCDEIVDWWVIEKPLKVSAAGMDKLRPFMERIKAADRGTNARPVQPLNGRQINVF